MAATASGLPFARLSEFALGIAQRTQRAVWVTTVRAGEFGGRVGGQAIEIVMSPPIVRRSGEFVGARLAVVADEGAEVRRRETAQVAQMVGGLRPIVESLLREVVALLPVNELLARVDLDALLARIDVNAIISQVDISALVTEALAGLELGDLIHDSTTSVAVDARDAVRVQAAKADRGFAGVVDRILRRGALDRGLPAIELGLT